MTDFWIESEALRECLAPGNAYPPETCGCAVCWPRFHPDATPPKELCECGADITDGYIRLDCAVCMERMWVGERPDPVPQWTSKPPTEPGLYWFSLIDSDGTRRHCVVMKATKITHELYDYLKEGDLYVFVTEKPTPVVQMHRVWAGPLLSPVGEATHGETGE